MYLHSSINGAQIKTESDLADFVRDSYRRSYFLHFAGCGHLMPVLSEQRGHTET
jgi:hypothetical protein